MKRWLCAILLLTMIALIPAQGSAEKHEFFDTIVVEGVNYYDMLGSKESSFNSGPDTFFKDYLQIQTTQGSTKYPSVMEEWCQVAEAILAGTDPDNPKTKWDNYQSDAQYTPMEKSFSSVGTANSIDAAAKAAVAAHNSMSVPSGCDPYSLLNPSGLDNAARNCVYYVKHGFPKHEEGVTTRANGSYAIIFSDFQIAQVVSDGYIETNVMDTDNYKLTKYDPSSVNAQVFTNDTLEPAQATASLTTTVSETVTLTTTDSYQYSESKSWNIGGKLMLGNKDWYGGGEVSGGFSQTWSNVTGKSFSNAEAKTSGTTNTSTLSAALPPYTEATVIQSKGKGDMSIKIDLPVAVFYNVTIVYLCNGKINGADAFTAYYRGTTGRNSTDARDDLYQRVLKGAAEPDEVNNATDTMKALAQKIYGNVPLSKANTGFDYQIEYNQSRLSEVRPMKNLSRVELKDKRTNITLSVGDPLDVSTVQVVGLNDASAPYFGFDDAKGSWILEDTDGKPIKDNKNEYIELMKDAVTDKLTLTALKAGGEFVLKFQVPEKTYIDVDKTPVGTTGDKIVYIDPKDVDNQATIVVRTTIDVSGYTVEAFGEVNGCVGDVSIDLDGDVSPVAAYAMNADGQEVTVPIIWRAQLNNGTISINKDNTLTFLKAGKNSIRAEWGAIHSEWLPVVVTEPSRLDALELADPRELLSTVRWSDATTSLTYDLSGLDLKCLDQYEEEMDNVKDLAWYVSKDKGDATKLSDPKTFKVTASGVYDIHVQSADGAVVSNSLKLTVEEAPRPVRLTLTDDEDVPLLGDYILHSGTDEFDLAKLHVSGVDQYGDKYAVDVQKLTWVVNGKNQDGATLKVDAAGKYAIRCLLPGMADNSNAVTLNVLAARAPAKMVLADDPYNPLLAAYILHDGDDTFELSKLTATCVDEYGDPYPLDTAVLIWMVNGEALEGNALTVDKAGAYDICFTTKDSGILSNALTLTVTAARMPAALTLADDPYAPLLADTILHNGDDTFRLSKLTIACKDQYGDNYLMEADRIIWTVNGAAIQGDTLTVTEPGKYDICFTLDGVSIQSNALTLTVTAARVPAALTLADDPYAPLLADTILHDGSDAFRLSKLTVACVDQYGDNYPMEADQIIWTVNGAAIQGDTLTVNEPGKYDVSFTLDGAKVRSNALTLKVLAARHLYALTIADDSVSPMLEDYPLGSGSDRFDLNLLVVGASDQYGDPHPFDGIDWYVNGEYLPDGILTVATEGSYVIHAVATEGDLFVESNKLTLKVVPYVLSLTLNSESLTMSPGEQYQLVATASPVKRGDAFTYVSSRPTVADVDGNGVITAKAEGKAVITVSNTTGLTAQCAVIVTGLPESIALTPNEMLLGVNESGQLSAKVLPKGASTALTYSSSDESVVKVTASGKVTGVAVGTATLRVQTHNGLYDECFVKVVKAAAGIDAPDELILGVKENFDLANAVTISTARSNALTQLTYRSMDPSIATVSDKGVVTAKKVGDTGITVTSYNGISKAIPVTVKKAPKSVMVIPKKKTLKKTDRLQLKVTLSKGSAGAVSFKSSKPKVISVTPDGTVIAHKKGNATITVKTYNGKKAKCTITCNGKNPLTLKVSKGIDLSKPNSYVLIKPSVTKDWEDYTLTITAKKDKKKLGDVTDQFEITLAKGNAIKIRISPDNALSSGTVCTVSLKVDQGYRTVKATKSFTLKMSGTKAAPAPDPLALNYESVSDETGETEIELDGN